MTESLDTPLSQIAPIGLPRGESLTLAKMERLLELPVRGACQRLWEMGIRTLESTANRENIGHEAGFSIDMASLAAVNDLKLRQLARRHDPLVHISVSGDGDEIVSLRLPVPGSEVTARHLHDRFMALLDEAALLRQPAFWAAPEPFTSFCETRQRLLSGTQGDKTHLAAYAGHHYDEGTDSVFQSEVLAQYYRACATQAEPGTGTQVTGSARKR
jgi:hypothetical protein